MKKSLLILLCLCLSVHAWSAKRAMSFTDMFAAGRLSSPAVSADGTWVVFAVKTADLTANTFQTDLYAADMQGRAMKKLTAGQGNNFNPCFLKSGLLTFVSTRNGDPQVFSMDLNIPPRPRSSPMLPAASAASSGRATKKASPSPAMSIPGPGHSPNQRPWKKKPRLPRSRPSC